MKLQSRIVLVALSSVLAVAGQLVAQTKTVGDSKLGVVLNKPEAFQGYTLVFPLRSTHTYLVDMSGRVVNTWKSRYGAGQEAYLLDNGNLLRAANLGENEAIFAGASQGGRIQEFTWDGRIVWDYKFHNEKQIRHHAITRMPNGNILMIVWERKTAKDTIDAGGRAGSGEMLVDCLIEVQPQGKTTGKVVWEWHVWDHLIQDHDPKKPNYGDVAAHPELIDINFARSNQWAFGVMAMFAGRGGNPADTNRSNPRDNGGPAPSEESKAKSKQDEAFDRLRGIGYAGAASNRAQFAGFFPDWLHVNGVAYNAELDQIMLSVREFSEIWIIDRSTTTKEAAGHAGGRYGKGGDLLYRWGNPQAYRAGSKSDQRLFAQHDAHWIPKGLPGAGHMLVFNNGMGRPGGDYSSVDEVELPVNADGTYPHDSGAAFGPKDALWSYSNKAEFRAPLMSGAQRLPNGNTLIAAGFSGRIFEVTPNQQVVWDMNVPEDGHIAADGRGGFGRGGPPPFGPPPGDGEKDSKGAKAPRGRPGPGGGPGGFGGFFGMGGAPGSAGVFRAYRYGAEYPGLAGKDLLPSKALTDLHAESESP